MLSTSLCLDSNLQLDALPNDGKMPRFQEFFPNKIGTPEGLHTALIMDTHIRDGDEAAEGLRHLATLKIEPPAAKLPPIVGDVDQKIIDMAYDLSFKKRPLKAKASPKKRGGKLLKTLKKLKRELKQVNLKSAKKAKKAKKGKGKGKGKGKAAPAAAKAGEAAAEQAEAQLGGKLAEAANTEAKF